MAPMEYPTMARGVSAGSVLRRTLTLYLTSEILAPWKRPVKNVSAKIARDVFIINCDTKSAISLENQGWQHKAATKKERQTPRKCVSRSLAVGSRDAGDMTENTSPPRSSPFGNHNNNNTCGTET